MCPVCAVDVDICTISTRFAAVDSTAVGVVASAYRLTPVGSGIVTSWRLNDDDDDKWVHGFVGGRSLGS